MQARTRRAVIVAMCAVLGAAILGSMLDPSPCRAGETGVLKLKVRQCLSSNWISGADVDVSIQRPGSGEVDSAKGTTNSTGYVEFTFYNLEGDDEAHVTVTPSGLSPDGSHTYYWIGSRARNNGYFNLTADSDSICDDEWYDLGNRIFLCKYH